MLTTNKLNKRKQLCFKVSDQRANLRNTLSNKLKCFPFPTRGEQIENKTHSLILWSHIKATDSIFSKFNQNKIPNNNSSTNSKIKQEYKAFHIGAIYTAITSNMQTSVVICSNM